MCVQHTTIYGELMINGNLIYSKQKWMHLFYIYRGELCEMFLSVIQLIQHSRVKFKWEGDNDEWISWDYIIRNAASVNYYLRNLSPFSTRGIVPLLCNVKKFLILITLVKKKLDITLCCRKLRARIHGETQFI